jgi:hypothetical protein
MLAGNAAQHNKVKKNSVFYAEIFHIKSPNENIVYVTYLR